MQILEFCLGQTKNTLIFPAAAKLATLSVLWSLGSLDEAVIEKQLFTILRQWKGRGKYETLILSCLVCILGTAESVETKVIEGLMKDEIVPIIRAAAEEVLAEQSGEIAENDKNDAAEDDDDFGGPTKDYLIEFLESWQACMALMTKEQATARIKDDIGDFLQLLDHSVDSIRVSVAHCLLTIVDLAERYQVDVEEEMKDVCKTMSRVIYDLGFDWGDGSSRKAFEQLLDLIQNAQTVVTVDLMTVSANPTRGQQSSAADYRFYEANANKKGHPVAGYADAALINFFHAHLADRFADLFSVKDIHSQRSNRRTFAALQTILTRHPASRSAAIHVDSLRSFGAGSFTPGRSFTGRDDRSRNAKIRVADFI